MGEHTTGKRQHIVPRQMIRNFTGDDGKVVELVKPEFSLGTRRRSASKILYRDDYYQDVTSDFDADLLTRIEQKFAPVYPEVLNNAQLNGQQGAAFVDWTAAMLVRTQMVAGLMPRIPEGVPKPIEMKLGELKKLSDNIARTQLFELYQDLLARSGWQWKFRRFPGPCLVISDHPVCITTINSAGGQLVVVPMSSDTVLFGGDKDSLEHMRDATPLSVNLFVAANAERHIFAASKDILEEVKDGFSDSSPFDPAFVKAGRCPLYGLPERIRERIKSNPMPENFDFEASLREHCASFGKYRWDVE